MVSVVALVFAAAPAVSAARRPSAETGSGVVASAVSAASVSAAASVLAAPSVALAATTRISHALLLQVGSPAPSLHVQPSQLQ